MGYLYSQDYLKQVQSTQLAQIKGSDATLSAMERAAEAEVKAHLVQKYLIDDEFRDLNTWSYTVAYNAGDRVYLDATAYSASSTYALNSLTLYSGNVYRCTTAITLAEAWNAAHWTLVGAQYALYYAKYPNPVFDVYAVYKVDDIVFYKNKRYKCKIATVVPSQFTALQYGSYNNIPLNNLFPDATNGATYWTDLGTYSVAANTLPTNTTYWTEGDNRNQQILMYLIDIVLYHLHCRIAPQNIPELRQNRYDDAKAFLTDVAKGNHMTLDLPKIQPKQGRPIRWGGDVKQINSY